MEVSAENDRFSSNDLVVRVDAESRRNLREHSSLYLVHARLDESAGALRLDKNQRSKRNSGSVLVGAVLSFTVALAAAGLVVFKISRFVFTSHSAQKNLCTNNHNRAYVWLESWHKLWLKL